MDFQTAIKTCLQKYADFNGRATRPEFWWFFLGQLIVLAVTGMVSNLLYGVAALAMLLPGLAVGARRMHDLGKTAWLLLVGLIPVLGALLLLYWFAQPGEPGANAYGAPAAPAAPAPTQGSPGQQ